MISRLRLLRALIYLLVASQLIHSGSAIFVKDIIPFIAPSVLGTALHVTSFTVLQRLGQMI